MATTQQQNALLRQGSKGNDVSAVQQALKNYGFYGGVVDGLFGPKTAEAVKNFQNMTGIKVDAIVGPQTQSKIKEWAWVKSRFKIVGTGFEPVRSFDHTCLRHVWLPVTPPDRILT